MWDTNIVRPHHFFFEMKVVKCVPIADFIIHTHGLLARTDGYLACMKLGVCYPRPDTLTGRDNCEEIICSAQWWVLCISCNHNSTRIIRTSRVWERRQFACLQLMNFLTDIKFIL